MYTTQRRIQAPPSAFTSILFGIHKLTNRFDPDSAVFGGRRRVPPRGALRVLLLYTRKRNVKIYSNAREMPNECTVLSWCCAYHSCHCSLDTFFLWRQVLGGFKNGYAGSRFDGEFEYSVGFGVGFRVGFRVHCSVCNGRFPRGTSNLIADWKLHESLSHAGFVSDKM